MYNSKVALSFIAMFTFAQTVIPSCFQAQQPKADHGVTEWLTTADRASLLAEQPRIAFSNGSAQEAAGDLTVDVDPASRMQTMDGFGFALTGGSAELLMRMSPTHRSDLLHELFGTGPGSIGVSYLRVSIGSSDLNERVFTYDDLPAGQTDPKLEHFDLGPDRADVVPVLQEILAIHPHLAILASPWSAPSWMKTNGAPKGGSLKPEFYAPYAQYFVDYLKSMAALGIPIHAITIQNEPLNANNTPSMIMQAPEEAEFIKTDLGPALQRAGLSTQIILYDHNCDRPDYPLSILADPQASAFVQGSGFHLYGGAITALTQVHDAYPTKDLYFTEQMVVQDNAAPTFKIADPVTRIIIGATRNWSRNVLLWNLAADPHFDPHTPDGGCPVCQGAITLDGDRVEKNLAFYTIAHIAKFVPPGSTRIGSSTPLSGTLPNVAFMTPDMKYVLIVSNPQSEARTFTVRTATQMFRTTLQAGAVGTYIWH